MIITHATVDFGKAGIAHVTVRDPCDTPEKCARRNAEILRVCQELLRRRGD
ncbi:MAG: hypothetical protein RR295_10815 [Oscillospiraceae bacterium]